MSQEQEPWIPPYRDAFMLGLLGKSQEELSELQKILARVLLQGLWGVDPKTKQVNYKALEEEIADMRAMIQLLIEYCHLDIVTVAERTDIKKLYINNWLNKLKISE